MPTALRDTGIDVVGAVRWGAHFSIFYETRSDLFETVARYFRAGLAGNEVCLWVVSHPMTKKEATGALRRRMRDLDRGSSLRDIEVLTSAEWYVRCGRFEPRAVIRGWQAKLPTALDKGYAGLRICGDAAWAKQAPFKDIQDYERKLHTALVNRRIIALCTYPLSKGRAADVLELARLHKFTVARRKGAWEIVQTPEPKEAKQQLQRLHHEFERRIGERTRQLLIANEQLRDQITERKRAEEQLQVVQAEMARVGRLTTLGAFAASVAHEINQPLTAAVANGEAALRLLASQPPRLVEARHIVKSALSDADRAGRVVKRMRLLLTRARPRRTTLDMNEVVREVLAQTRSDQSGNKVSVQTKLSPRLARVRGDKVQLQQVMLNLIKNAIEAMSANRHRPRRLLITTRMQRPDGVLVSVADTGPGLDPKVAARLFDPVFTTKPKGMGMGLPVCSSIVEAHGGRLWASTDHPRGAVFRFTLPAAHKRRP